MNVEDVVKEVLEREAQDVEARPAPWAGLQRRAALARRARLVAGGLSLAAAVAAVTMVASTLNVDDDRRVNVTSGGGAERAPADPDVGSSPTPGVPPSTPATSAPPPPTLVAPAPPTTDVAPTTDTTAAAPASPTTTTTTTTPPDPVCTAPEGGTAPPATRAELETRLAQAWHLCAAPSVFGTGEAGIELRADHRWSKLSRAADGSYRRLSGWGDEGTWETLDTSSMNGPGSWQLNLHIDGGGTVAAPVAFARDVPKMRLTSNAVYVADYRALPGGSVSG